MKKIKNIYIITAISLSAFSLLFCIFILNVSKTSYAIETGTFTNGFPTGSFSTNADSTNFKNYINTAFGSDNSYANFLNNFNVPDSYYDDNNTNPLYVITKNLELPKATETFELSSDSVNDVDDKGLTYIINHGFNNTNSVNTIFTKKKYKGDIDNSIKQYITQIAIWLYVYENKSNFSSTYCKDTGDGYSACDFIDNAKNAIESSTVRTIISRASENSSYEYLKYITDLVDAAKDYQGEEESLINNFTNINYSLTNDGSMLYIYNLSPTIPSNLENYMYYAVEVEDPNSYGVYIADKNDNKITNTNQMSESFSVVIPIDEDITKIDLSSITIKVYAYFVVDQNKTYIVTKSTQAPLPNTTSNLVIKYNDNKYDRFADVVLGYTPYQIVSTQFKLKNITMISKVDATNQQELPGATLVLKSKDDSSDEWTWVSTDKPHMLELEDGEYSLCETIAPSGYEPKTECIDFSVEEGKVNAVKMENSPVHIPNTGATINRMIILFGFGLVIAGIGIFSYFVFYKKKGIIKEV